MTPTEEKESCTSITPPGATRAPQLAQLPWFARNVLFKVLVLAGLRPVAHRLGLPAGMHWPY